MIFLVFEIKRYDLMYSLIKFVTLIRKPDRQLSGFFLYNRNKSLETNNIFKYTYKHTKISERLPENK